jgi:hypothetical protein
VWAAEARNSLLVEIPDVEGRDVDIIVVHHSADCRLPFEVSARTMNNKTAKLKKGK